ncbi:MAG: hypothetical protein QXS14_05975 [Desulfurococcaceae archaeon]
MIISLGKPLVLPLGLLISPLDNPFIRRFDLGLITPVNGNSVEPGSLVLACLPGWWNTACILGRYVVNSNGLGYLETVFNGFNGENQRRIHLVGNGVNGANGFRLFRVVLVVPREVWIPLVALVAFIPLAKITFSLRKTRALGEHTTFLPALSIVLLFNTMIAGGMFVEQSTPQYTIPGVEAVPEFYLENSTVIVRLRTGDYYTLLNASCTATVGVDNGVNRINNYNNGNNGNRRTFTISIESIDKELIVLRVPWELYEEAYNSRFIPSDLPLIPSYLVLEEVIPFRCKLYLDKGEMILAFTIRFKWSDLVLRYEDGSVVVVNDNPVDLNATAVIVDLDRETVVYSTRFTLSKLSSYTVNLRELGVRRARVYVLYEFLGLTRSVSAYVEQHQ